MSILIILLCFGGCFYAIYANRDITPIPKNQTTCISLIYFNPNKHLFDTTYTEAITFADDSIVNFKDVSGNIWKQSDFISNKELKDDDGVSYNDITLKNGERFRIIQVSDGGCKIKSVEDSIKATLGDTENEN